MPRIGRQTGYSSKRKKRKTKNPEQIYQMSVLGFPTKKSALQFKKEIKQIPFEKWQLVDTGMWQSITGAETWGVGWCLKPKENEHSN